MTRCTSCNWAPHDVSVHELLCRNGHPLAVVGVYTKGQTRPVCRACVRAAVRRYRQRNLERERARVRIANRKRRLHARPVGNKAIGATRDNVASVSVSVRPPVGHWMEVLG